VITPMAKTYDMPSLPKEGELFDQYFILRDKKTQELLPNIRYELTTASGKKLRGISDAAGRTCKVSSRDAETLSIKVMRDIDIKKKH
jgi:uncharacterized protein (DUF2345 family)